MRLLAFASILAGTAAPVLSQLIALGAPTNGQVLNPGQYFLSQVVQTASPQSCIQVGIALSLASCDQGDCPTPEQALGYTLYAGPFTPNESTEHGPAQSFVVQVPESAPTGPAVFTLTHLCLLGGGPIPLLEYRNASVTIKSPQ